MLVWGTSPFSNYPFMAMSLLNPVCSQFHGVAKTQLFFLALLRPTANFSSSGATCTQTWLESRTEQWLGKFEEFTGINTL